MQEKNRERHARFTGTVIGLLAGAVWGIGDVFTKSVYTHGANLPLNFSIVRISITLVFYFLMLVNAKAVSRLRISIDMLVKPFAYGVTVAAFVGLFLFSLTLTSVANATLLIYTSPIFVAIIARIWLKEKLTSSKLIGIVLSLLGASLVLGLPSGIHIFASHIVGDLAALAAGVATAGVFVVGKIQSPGLDEKVILFYGFVFALLLLFPVTIFAEGFNPLGLVPALPYVFGSALASAGGYLLSLIALRKIEATRASVYALTEPVVASVLAGVFLSEIVDSYTIIGGVLILAAVVVVYYWARK